MSTGARAHLPGNGGEPAPTAFAPLLATARAAADELRAGVLRVLKDESYSVLELCRILNTGQPGLSHHLKILYRAGLVSKRREGNTIFYRRSPVQTALHRALLDTIDEVPLPAQQGRRIDEIHRERSRVSEAFFTEHAADFAANQARICEAHVYAGSVMDMVRRLGLGDGTALEVGPGDGELLELLAGQFQRVVGIDNAREMLERCGERVGARHNVQLLHHDVAELPRRAQFQLVVAAMLVHHQPSPQRFFHHVHRLLCGGGALIVAELCRHDHEWARAACGDLWLGFEPAELTEWAANARLEPGEAQFLAQKNGFRIQIHTFHQTTR